MRQRVGLLTPCFPDNALGLSNFRGVLFNQAHRYLSAFNRLYLTSGLEEAAAELFLIRVLDQA